jgi:hypothetical protein
MYEGILSAVKEVEFVSDMISYIILRGLWCHLIVLRVNDATEDKNVYVNDTFYEELEHGFHGVRKYHTKILLGDFIAKLGKEDIFKQTIGNETLHEISNDKGVRVVNFATSKNVTVRSTMIPHPKIDLFIYIYSDISRCENT